MQEFIYDPKKIYYRMNEFKTGRKTLVFVHGITGSSAAWGPYENKFKNDYNILTFDLRGHGKSWKPKDLQDYKMSKFAEDLLDLVTFIKINSFILISHSFGVLVALEFLTQHLNKIERLILISPSYAPNRIGAGKVFRPLLNLVSLFKLIPFNQNSRGHVDYSRHINSGDWNIPRMIADVKETSLRVFLYGTKQSYEVDYEFLLRRIKVPVLILHGRRDTIFPVSHSLYIHDKIKNSQLLIIENSNHILVLNNFLEVSRAIRNFC